MIRMATPADAAGILAIYAPVVRSSAISFELAPPSVGEMRRRIKKVLADRPWMVFERDDEVLGYVYASTFRDRPAYRWSTEVSVYIHEDARGRGLASTLYHALFDVLQLQGYCTVVAGATVPNPASERLHTVLGFQLMGVLPAAGYKFGVWHDVAFFHRTLRPLPKRPREPIPIANISAKKLDNAIKKQTIRL
jgi:L-amino acid N-acyltransferase YncA